MVESSKADNASIAAVFKVTVLDDSKIFRSTGLAEVNLLPCRARTAKTRCDRGRLSACASIKAFRTRPGNSKLRAVSHAAAWTGSEELFRNIDKDASASGTLRFLTPANFNPLDNPFRPASGVGWQLSALRNRLISPGLCLPPINEPSWLSRSGLSNDGFFALTRSKKSDADSATVLRTAVRNQTSLARSRISSESTPSTRRSWVLPSVSAN